MATDLPLLGQPGNWEELEHSYASLQTWLGQLASSVAALTAGTTGLVQVGTISAYGGTSAPTAWLLCNGNAVSRSTYSALFTIIGTAYGAGDGATTFNLPDLRQRFPLGKAAAGTGVTMGSTGGAVDHTHTGPSHTHTISSDGSHSHTGSTGNESSHTHGAGSYQVNALQTSISVGVGAFSTYDNTIANAVSGTSGAGSAHNHSISSDGAHTHGGATGAGGTGATSANNPPYQVVNFIIYAGV